jgi:hypothetical protein
MRTLFRIALCSAVLLFSAIAGATIFGSIHGLIHDPQHRPVEDAKVKLQALTSDWSQTAASDHAGEFLFENVPLGEYRVIVEVPGFATEEQKVVLTSGRDAEPHFSLTVAHAAETVEVQDIAPAVNPESSTSTNIVSRDSIARTPGGDGANSLAMITDYTPGAYMVHDQLHIRGGHQVSWLLDGVPVPNTNIASNVGPQFDPKDVDYLEVQRGGYNAEYGDRTFGVFNVVTRSGFERDRQGELVLSYGSYNTPTTRSASAIIPIASRVAGEPFRLPDRPRSRDADRRREARSGGRTRRIRLAHFQQVPERSIAPGHVGSRRPLPGAEYAGSAGGRIPRRRK